MNSADERRLLLNDAVTDWAVRMARRAIATDALEAGIRWSLVASRVATEFGTSRLVIPALEEVLRTLAGSVGAVQARTHQVSGRRRWLHVLSRAYEVGGHTALAERWIERDCGSDTHDLALTFESRLQVPSLGAAVEASGGSVTTLGHIASLMGRAAALRQLAAQADVVVWHVHQWDVVAAVACGYLSGPPVLIVNHADHSFWVGASVADAVISLRASGQRYAQQHRGIDRHLYLPIPLPPPVQTSEADRGALRSVTRSRLGVPANAVMFLTVGSEYKYTPLPGLDFVGSAREIVARMPLVYVVAAGPSGESRQWLEASRATEGRVRAIGVQRPLEAVFAAADVYMEGFPFGSLTAMLEAAASGLPLVRAPSLSPPPFTSDGEAFDSIEQPGDGDAFIAQCVSLAESHARRAQLTSVVRDAVTRLHTGEGWARALEALHVNLPSQRALVALAPPLPPDEDCLARWAHLCAVATGSEPVWLGKTLAELWELQPAPDADLRAVLARRREFIKDYRAGRLARLYPRPVEKLIRGVRLALGRSIVKEAAHIKMDGSGGSS